MFKRFFLLISIGLLAIGLVSLVLVTASSASMVRTPQLEDGPTIAKLAQPLPIHYSSTSSSQSASPMLSEDTAEKKLSQGLIQTDETWQQVKMDSQQGVPSHPSANPELVDRIVKSEYHNISSVNEPEYVLNGITFDLVRERILGRINPGDLITITRSEDGAYGSAQADGDGFFWTSLFAGDNSGHAVDISGSEEFEIMVDGSMMTVTLPQEAVGGVDVVNDQVYGTIPDYGQYKQVYAKVGLWGTGPLSGYGSYGFLTSSGGSFSFPLNFDAGAENFVAIEYQAAGNIYVRTYLTPDPLVFLVEQNNIVAGYAPPNTTITTTIYANYPSDIRSVDLVNGSYPFGFYQLDGLEIAPGDVVEIEFEDGTTITTTNVTLGHFSYDTADDIVYGSAPPFSTVRVNFWDWDTQPVYTEIHAVADSEGNFEAEFLTNDLRPSNAVDIMVADLQGNQTHMISGPPHIEVYLDPESEYDCVVGRVDAPGQPVTLTIETETGIFTRTNPIGPSDPGNQVGGYGWCYLMWGPEWGPIDFTPGDIVTLQSPSWQGQVEIVDLSWEADTVNDWIFGNAPTGNVGVRLSQWQSNRFPEDGSAETRTNSNGTYTAYFTAFDVRDGFGSLEIRYYDPTTDYITNLQGKMRYMQVEPPGGVSGYTPVAHEDMTAFLYDEFDNLLAANSNDQDDNPFYFRFGDFGGNQILPGYKVEIDAESGWSASLLVPEITVNADVDTDLISGDAPKGLLYIEGGDEESGFGSFTPVDGYALDTAWLDYDLQLGNRIFVNYLTLNGNRVMRSQKLCELCSVELWVTQTDVNWMWGEAQPGAAITITTPHEQIDGIFADGWGYWELNEPIEFYPGDEISVVASPGMYPVTFIIPDPLEAYADSSIGEVWGGIGGWYTRDVEIYPNWDEPPQAVQTGADGTFSAGFSNMVHGSGGYIRIVDEIFPTQIVYHHPFYDLTPALHINYGHDWIDSEYDPGYTVWITLTDSIGSVKGTASGETGLVEGWGGRTGFASYTMDWSTGNNPDFQPGDWVYVSLDNGHFGEVHVGTIDGQLDVNTDIISGTITVPWFESTSTLSGNCSIWVQDGPGINFDVYPNGGSYECNFGNLGWDIFPGHDVGVSYFEPDNDQVINVFRGPAPHLWVNIWGEGEAAEGGNYVLNVEYNNDGDGLAENVNIAVVLREGMGYLGDTTGLTPIGTGQPDDPLIWQLGDLPVSWYSSQRFEIYVEVTAGLGEQVAAEANIDTATVYFQGDSEKKYSYWSGNVVENNTDLSVSKWAWTGDPLPDGNFVYVVNVCNESNTASSRVYLTDTLPLSTTLDTWWAQRPGWEEETRSDHLLTVSHPSLTGGVCRQVNIRVHLDVDAWQEMPLENNAIIYTNNDTNSDNDTTTMDHKVGGPHTNLSLYKNWNWGNFVPGGQVNYEFTYQNTGNLPITDVWVTNTLPANSTFLFAYTWGETGWVPLTPTVEMPGYLVWEVGLLENGYGMNLGVAVELDPLAEPGSIFTDTVEISPKPHEDRYVDNMLNWVEQVNEPGPNLRIDKHSNWRWTWEGQLEFELRILNLGTEPLENVWITDTYPISTSFNGNWWQNHGPSSIPWSYDADNRLLTMKIEYLNPGDTASVGYRCDLDPEFIGVQGLSYTNLLAAPVEGDVFPDDNFDQVTAYTGPDVFIRKWLSDGILEQGEVVTYTVEFGNQNLWPWDGDPDVGSHITETLPTGVEFLSASAPWNADETWDYEYADGNTVVWSWSPMWNQSLWTFQINALINDTAQRGVALTNTIEAFGDSPFDIEPNWENNHSDYVFQIDFIRLFLPLLLR